MNTELALHAVRSYYKKIHTLLLGRTKLCASASARIEDILSMFCNSYVSYDCLCGLVVRVLGYKFRGPGFDSRRCQIF
jgi:hypothetical protein